MSQVELAEAGLDTGVPLATASFQKAEGTKCDRCWRYTEDVGSEGMYPGVCARCADALEKIGFAPMNEEQPA